MREFMTKVSDYISERRNDPEKNGNLMVFCMLGVVILVIIILCLLLLWRKNAAHKEQEMTAETFEEVSETILAEPSEDEELKQQYLTNIQYLGEKVEELLNAMTETRETLKTVTVEQQEENAALKEQVENITTDISNLIVQLENTQSHLYDLTDIVNVMNGETLPLILERISEIENQMEQSDTDIAAIYDKISSLETTDEELKAKINEIEGNLKKSVEQNLADIRNRFDHINNQIYQVEVKIGDAQTQIADTQTQINTLRELVENVLTQMDEIRGYMQGSISGALKYRYEADTNTLYLLP